MGIKEIFKSTFKKYRLSDLNSAKTVFKAVDLRKQVSVVIIDDDPFPKLDSLKRVQFDIIQLTDIEDLNAVVSYPVVICDIRGIGHKFSKDMEGAYVAKELKRKFPFKQIAVYSAESSYRIESIDSDGIKRIKKDYDLETWSSCIDELIKKVADPKEVWKSIREYLLNKDVSIDEVTEMESDYVDLCLHRPSELSTFANNSNFNLKEDVRSVIQSMIAGVLLKCVGI